METECRRQKTKRQVFLLPFSACLYDRMEYYLI